MSQEYEYDEMCLGYTQIILLELDPLVSHNMCLIVSLTSNYDLGEILKLTLRSSWLKFTGLPLNVSAARSNMKLLSPGAVWSSI